MRASSIAAATVAASVLLTGCFGGPANDKPGTNGVSFKDAETAAIQIEAVGTFLDPEGEFEGAGYGSGFIISESGLALTNNHVVVGAGTLKVYLEGEEHSAQILGTSECLDLAVIQLDPGTYPYYEWHDGDITTAMEVYSAGFPLGDPEFTMTKGIVGKDGTQIASAWAYVDTVIEHDARIQHGNSGGPLIDADGKVVGINYAGEDGVDRNFAIHRDEVLPVLDDLIAGTDVLSIGINGRGVTGTEGQGIGVWVSSVAAGSPADKAGIEPGDIITRFAGVSVGLDGTLKDYCDVLRTQGIDQTIDIEVYRHTEGIYYRGQVNGDELEAVQVVGQDGGSQGGGGGGGGSTADFVTVNDDHGIIGVEVPASWSQVDGAPFENDLGVWASVVASPDVNAFNSGWDVPGVSIAASQDAVGLIPVEDVLSSAGDSLVQGGCVSDGSDTYDDSYHLGVYEIFRDCGGVGTSYILVSAQAVDNSYMILVGIQAINEADFDAADRVLGSFIAQF